MLTFNRSSIFGRCHRMRVVLCMLALGAFSAFGHVVQAHEVKEPRPVTELSAEEIEKFKEDGKAWLAAMSAIKQRAEAENIPQSEYPPHPFRRPIAVGDFIPFKFKHFETLPKVLLTHSITSNPSMDELLSPIGFMALFNVQVLGEGKGIELPSTITMEYALTKLDSVVDRNATMVLNKSESSYYFKNGTEVLRDILDAIKEVHEATPGNRNRPSLEIRKLVGFENLHADVQRSHFPGGLPIVYSYRIENLRVYTDHSWVGQAIELKELYENSRLPELYDETALLN